MLHDAFGGDEILKKSYHAGLNVLILLQSLKNENRQLCSKTKALEFDEEQFE